MFFVVFLDNLSGLIATLHVTQAAAEARFEELLRDFVIEPGAPLPPRNKWSELFDSFGENPHIYRVAGDGRPAEEIHPFSEHSLEAETAEIE